MSTTTPENSTVTPEPQAVGVAAGASGSPSEWIAYIAAQWESRPERLADVIEQVKAIYEKMCEWRMTPDTRDELDHGTICYSHVCVSYNCCQWLPFGVMPDWEDDLYSVLMDEDFWREQRDLNRMGYDIAEMIRAREENNQGQP